jgi:uncharacterized membrane protein YedE/YeeE
MGLIRQGRPPMSGYAVTVAISLVLGLATGVVMHRADFCLTAIFRDFFLFRRTFMLKILLLTVAFSALLFEGGRLTGLLKGNSFGGPSLTNIIGGILFGVGMVIAGGCVVGTLYKMGAGSVVSATAFAGLIAGSFLYAEFHPWWGAVRQSTLFWTGKVTLPQLLDIPPFILVALLLVAAAIPLIRWSRRGDLTASSSAEGFLQPWKAALVLSLIGLLSWATVGMPLGITTSYSKWGAWLVGLAFPGHVADLSFLQIRGTTWVQPLTGAAMSGGPGPGWDGIAAVQYPLIAGIVAGSALSALALGEWALRYRAPRRQFVAAFTGGMIMGLASRMAPACNVWHLLGGLPILALQSVGFVVGLIPGAWIGSRLLTRFVLPWQPTGR